MVALFFNFPTLRSLRRPNTPNLFLSAPKLIPRFSPDHHDRAGRGGAEGRARAGQAGGPIGGREGGVLSGPKTHQSGPDKNVFRHRVRRGCYCSLRRAGVLGRPEALSFRLTKVGT